MSLPPVLAALRKHKSGVILIALQIALTLAIVCNAVFIIGQSIEKVNRPTGMNEQNLFVIVQRFGGASAGHGPASVTKLDAMERADLVTLRHLPDVESAASISSLPLLHIGDNADGAMLKPHQRSAAWFSLFYGGDQVLKTLGLRLIAGRNFTPNEVTHVDLDASGDPATPVAIVTQALAHTLFPGVGALGKTIYFYSDSAPTTIVGIVARLQTTDANSRSNSRGLASILLPVRVDSDLNVIAVRARPGRLAAAMHEARKALFASNPMRVMNNGAGGVLGIHPFSEIRARAYRADTGMSILMGIISVILLTITGAGIVGLTSFWVGQRRKQIGIHRALGATRRDILRYFQIENLVIACGGCVVGVILTFVINLGLMRMFAMHQIPAWYVAIGVAVILAIGQIAVFKPARRASNVPPVVATRSV